MMESFDSVPHDLLLKAVAHHTDERWVLLYIERWLTAPMQMEDGTLVAREKGTHQGSPISPLLAKDRRGERQGKRRDMISSGGDQEDVPEAFGWGDPVEGRC
jgi:retron-type reverse transcriptase